LNLSYPFVLNIDPRNLITWYNLHNMLSFETHLMMLDAYVLNFLKQPLQPQCPWF